MTIQLSTLIANYPTQSKAELYNELKGEWPSLINDENYTNTCAIRLSVALLKSGISIPNQYREAMTGEGKNLIIKVQTMSNFLTDTLGAPFWGMSKQPGQTLNLANTVPGPGILAYHVKWANATGHFDIWDGQRFIGTGNPEHVKDGYELGLWKLS
ncbi:T6SS effector amidase Tae4 family protein [Vibrio alfacsensis]|uniref:T6SS effector amidase Tae4 family protein n=1 Tax=Vibrio alfacsensis TaxID=1074311 RepID=UPI0040685A20